MGGRILRNTHLETVDGVSVTQRLAKIEARNPDKRVIPDNAACHKGPDVREFLARAPSVAST